MAKSQGERKREIKVVLRIIFIFINLANKRKICQHGTVSNLLVCVRYLAKINDRPANKNGCALRGVCESVKEEASSLRHVEDTRPKWHQFNI